MSYSIYDRKVVAVNLVIEEDQLDYPEEIKGVANDDLEEVIDPADHESNEAAS